MKNKVFLGGTCADSTWRDELIPLLKVPYFNPVVADWTPECQTIEMEEKTTHCNVHLYVITSAMKGVFSIAEAIDSVHTKGKFTMLQVVPEGFDKAQLKSLQATIDLVQLRGGVGFIESDISKTADTLNLHFA